MNAIRSWIVTDGAAGLVRQCNGLASRLGLEPDRRTIVIRHPWKALPPAFWPSPLSALSSRGDRLAPPWPHLVIASGRKSVAPTAAIRRKSGGRTVAIQIQNPTISPANFDLVIAPLHDRVKGANVIATTGSLHGLTRRALDEAADRHKGEVAHLPRPLILAAIGGPNQVYRFTCADARDLGRKLGALEGGLMVTVSRRTPPEAADVLMKELDPARSVIWQGNGSNPYEGWLGLADAIIVTSDSVNMATEACISGKPVFIAALPGGSEKFTRFHEALKRGGHARNFDGALAPSWKPVVLDDATWVAQRIRDRLGERFSFPGSPLECSGRS
ncbi:MAG: mitochondrial fission ELM1 family protein [bacterium]|nr:mitochondrial fission ELM1 family protein [bacterium]